MKRIMLILLGCFTLVGFIGCGPRAHLHPNYGKQNQAFFQRQHVYQEASPGAPLGLDSEEAALINDSYRKQLGGEKTCKDKAPTKVLLVEEKKNNKKN